LAALVMGTNVQLLTISIRSTPDAFLGLFVLISLIGFARLFFAQERSWRDYAFAYIGAALAVQTRGLPGLGVAAFPFFYWLIFARRRVRLRQLLEWKAMVLGLLVGFSWFGAMLWLHGREVIDGFIFDQVTENVRGYGYWDSLQNVQAYATGVLRHFLPWSALLALGLVIDREKAASFWREHRLKCWFLAGWFLFILAPFLFGEEHRTRYMTVAYPLLSVIIASLLTRYASDPRFEHWFKHIIKWAGQVMAGVGVLLAVAGWMVHPRLALAGLLLLASGIGIWLVIRRGIRPAYWFAVAALPLVAFWTVELCLRPMFARSPALTLTARLLPDPAIKQRVYAVNFSPSYQAQMRVFSGGHLLVSPLALDSSSALPVFVDPVVFGEKDKALFQSQSNRIEQAAYASRRWKARDFIDLFSPSKRELAWKRNLVPYYILRPQRP
jgi:4-amino-4-deoxy-L-arabinose transferase-like glycosyltransferase